MSSLEAEQSLTDHLSELRKRLIYAILAVAIGMGVSWIFSEEIMSFVRRPILPYLPEGGLIFTGVMDKFMAHVKVALVGGVILSCPIWLMQIWKFVSPGLYESERKYAGAFIGVGSLLFLTGISFVYFFVYPMAFDFLMSFGGPGDKPMISISEYLSFFTTTTLLFGLAFELPLVLVIMALVGLIDAQFLKKNRRYAIVVLALASALLTPPDIISMTMMMIPLLFLYESAIWAIVFLVKKRDPI